MTALAGRPEEGRAADRPVRRRLLLGLHRRRPDHGRVAPRRPAGRAKACAGAREGAGDFEVETITRPERGTDVILHLREGEEEFLSRWKLKSIVSKYSDHISLPILMQKEEWDAEAKQAGDQGRVGAGQQGGGAVDRGRRARSPRSSTRSSTSRSATTPRRRSPTPQPRRGPQRIHAAALHPGEGAVRPLEPRQARRRQALRQARLHHGRRRGADAGLPALRQGRDRLERPAAQRQPRAAAGKPRREGDPRGLDQARAVDARRRWPTARTRRRRRSTRRSGRTSASCSRKASARTSPTASAWPSCCASRRRTTTTACRTCRCPTTSARMKEGQEAIYYVTADTPGDREEQPAARDLPQEGHRGAAADRPRRRVDALAPVRVRRPCRCRASPRARSTSASSQDEAEKKQAEEAATAFKPTLDRLKEALKDRAKDVRVTTRLVDSPACLVVEEGDMSGHLARLLKQAGQGAPEAQADPRGQRRARAGEAARGERALRRPGATSCSTRRCSPRAASSRIRRPT